MGTALRKIDPLPTPTERAPMPSLPAWLVSRQNALVVNLQIDQATGRWQELVTLPAAMLPTDAQRAAIEAHLQYLNSLLSRTPASDKDALEAFTTAITKLQLNKPTYGASALAIEARAEAYEVALEDVPLCTILVAIRKWYRGDCGEDERGRPYDYQRLPDSAILRRVALNEMWKVKDRVKIFTDMLGAVAFVDCSAQLKRGQDAWLGLRKMAATAGALEGMTFAKAAEIGASLAPETRAAAE